MRVIGGGHQEQMWFEGIAKAEVGLNTQNVLPIINGSENGEYEMDKHFSVFQMKSFDSNEGVVWRMSVCHPLPCQYRLTNSVLCSTYIQLYP